MPQRISPAETDARLFPANRGLSDGAAQPPPRASAASQNARKLSRRQARTQVRIAQRWLDAGGGVWRVVNVHRKDGQVSLLGPGLSPMFVTFAALARDYRLCDEPTRGP